MDIATEKGHPPIDQGFEAGDARKRNVYLRNIAANWIGYGARLGVLFFLTPFIVHKLGDGAYGVWCLIISLTGYMGLLEIGVIASVSRHINVYMARNDWHKVNQVVCTSLCFFFGLSFVLFGTALSIAPFLDELFPKVPLPLISESRWILLILCGNIFFGFVSAVFRQLLAAKERFDLINVSALIVLAISTIGTVKLLQEGYGLIALAVIQVFSNAVGFIIIFVLARRWGPELKLKSNHITAGAFREVFHFGFFVFIADVGTHLIFYTDAVVIGAFIGAAAVTFYNIPLMLVEHGRGLIKQIRSVITPDLLKAGGIDRFGEAQWQMTRAIRLIMFFAVPILIGLITLGNEFISLWMGTGYEESYPILRLLAAAQLGSVASFPCFILLMGLGKVRFLALMAFLEGIVNLSLSLMFIRVFNFGIQGVALGTLIPMLIVSSVLVPAYACHAVHYSLSDFTRATVVRWGMATLLFLTPCLLAARFWGCDTWVDFFMKVCILTTVYTPIGVATLMDKSERRILIRILSRIKCAF